MNTYACALGGVGEGALKRILKMTKYVPEDFLRLFRRVRNVRTRSNWRDDYHFIIGRIDTE